MTYFQQLEVLTPTVPPGVIEPAILHEVAPLRPVRFYVEFYRLGEGGRVRVKGRAVLGGDRGHGPGLIVDLVA